MGDLVGGLDGRSHAREHCLPVAWQALRMVLRGAVPVTVTFCVLRSASTLLTPRYVGVGRRRGMGEGGEAGEGVSGGER